jgi:hypothetical protein
MGRGATVPVPLELGQFGAEGPDLVGPALGFPSVVRHLHPQKLRSGIVSRQTGLFFEKNCHAEVSPARSGHDNLAPWCRTLIKKKAGTVTLFAFDAGESLSEHTAP